MATLTIRNLSEGTRRALKQRAAQHNRSMEAEVRGILEDAVAVRVDFIAGWLSEAETVRGDFELPDRRPPRTFDLS